MTHHTTKKGRKTIESENRKDRRYTVTDTVHEGLKRLGNGSASQAVSDLYYEKVKKSSK